MKIGIDRIKVSFLNILFPKECVGCKKEGQWLCDKCLGAIFINEKVLCPSCGKPTFPGATCKQCLKKGVGISSLFCATSYQDEIVRKLIYSLKYHGCESVIHDLKPLFRKFLLKYQIIFPVCDLIIPVPLHSKRFKERGFNQAELVARVVADFFGRNLAAGILLRTKNNPPQADLAHNERATNVSGIFQVLKTDSLIGKSVLLADDVYTSGSTMQECARVLLRAGAREVHGFVIARG